MSEDSRDFVAWEERIISQERGNRIVHFYLKDSWGDNVLAVVGTERSIRHMIYVVSDKFLKAYGSKIRIKMCTKWRARREVVEWLTMLVPNRRSPICFLDSGVNEATEFFGGSETLLQDQKIQIPRKLKALNTSEIRWSGTVWVCSKQLKHYPAFCRNKTTLAIHSFVFIMAEEGTNYLGYLEDLYGDRKGLKKAKVRWFYDKKEVESVICELKPQPQEVFITPHVQVISAECIDGAATILTRKHYEKCLGIVPHTVSSTSYMCYRQFKSNKVQPFTLTKLRGYTKQPIFSCFSHTVFGNHKSGCFEGNGNDETNQVACENSLKRCNRDCRGHDSGASASRIQTLKSGSHNLKFKILKRPTGIELIKSQPQHHLPFKVNDKIELLCQDSGIRGCWFRCRILHICPKRLKVQYEDVQNVDGSGNLEEWVLPSRVASVDKLGMRCVERPTTRPCPIQDSCSHRLDVGAAVDAWWSDGWWEGILCDMGSPENDGVQVYIPGEKMFLMVQEKNIRTSRDWVSEKWVDIESKPELIPAIYGTTLNPFQKPLLCSMVGKASSESIDHKLFSALKLEEPKEDGVDVEENVKLKKRFRVDMEDEVSNGNCSDDDDDDDDNGNDSGEDDDDDADVDEDDDDDNDDDVDENDGDIHKDNDGENSVDYRDEENLVME